MYSRRMDSRILKCGRRRRRQRVQRQEAWMNVNVNKCAVVHMRPGYRNRRITMRIFSRHPNFSRACLPWIMRNCTWTRLQLQPPNSSHPLISISYWENKVRNYEMQERCGELRCVGERPEVERRPQMPPNDSAWFSRRITPMKKPYKKITTATNPFSSTRNMIPRITPSLNLTATSKNP